MTRTMPLMPLRPRVAGTPTLSADFELVAPQLRLIAVIIRRIVLALFQAVLLKPLY